MKATSPQSDYNKSDPTITDMNDRESNKTINILHIDDEEEFIELTEMMMSVVESSIAIEAVTDPRKIVSDIEIGEFDCIVSDLEMPGLDGIELLKKIRETDSEIPFIMFTNHYDRELKQEALDCGANGYFQKSGQKKRFSELSDKIKAEISC